MKTLLIVTLLFVVGSWAAEKCPTIDTNNKPFVDYQKLLRPWYEIRSSALYWWDWYFYKCNKQEISFNEEDETITFKKTYSNKAWFNHVTETDGNIELDEHDPRELTYTWKSLGISHSDGPYNVLGTDYENFLILWKCDSHWVGSYTKDVVILSTSPKNNLSDENISKQIDYYLGTVNDKASNYRLVNQAGC